MTYDNDVTCHMSLYMHNLYKESTSSLLNFQKSNNTWH